MVAAGHAVGFPNVWPPLGGAVNLALTPGDVLSEKPRYPSGEVAVSDFQWVSILLCLFLEGESF